MITIDVHEPDDFENHIEQDAKPETEWEREALNAGDFLAGDYILERKQYGDFIGRLTNSQRDIWQQMLKLEVAADELNYTPVLLLEGSWDEAMRWTNLTPKQPTMAIGSIMKLGINVVHTMGPRASAQLMIKLDDGTTHDIGSIRDSPSVPPEMLPQHIVEGFPGVGPSRAQDILDHFGTPQAVFNADTDELQEVSGIGSSTAQKIYDAARQQLPDDH